MDAETHAPDRDHRRHRLCAVVITWADLQAEITAAGELPEGLIKAFARQEARKTFLRRTGWGQKLARADVYREELAAVRDLAARALAHAQASPRERAARSCDLYAAIADSAIPPRRDEAARLRAQAAAHRASGVDG